MNLTFAALARRQLSNQLQPFATLAGLPRPTGGWLAATRQALDMTARQFAARLGVDASTASRLELRERNDGITLGALRRAAEALDCELVYAIVPRRTNPNASTPHTLETLIQLRAHQLATDEVMRVHHTMLLEDQGVRSTELSIQIAERTAALVAEPRRLWDVR